MSSSKILSMQTKQKTGNGKMVEVSGSGRGAGRVNGANASIISRMDISYPKISSSSR